MGEGNDIYQAWEDEHKDLNTDLAYRIFCNECDLPFHFWDELPEGSYDPEIGYKEMRLQTEAMKLFNKLKPEVVFYKNKIIRYQSQPWDGTDYCNEWPIDEYLEETSDELFYLKNLEKRFDIISSIFCILLSLVPFISISYLLMKFIPQDFKSSWFLVPGIIAAVFFFRWLYKTIWSIPKRIIDDGRLKGVEENLNSLRQKLTEIRGMRPNPLRQKRPGEIILGEWQPIISPMDIEKIHRIREKLYLVARNMSQEK